MINGLEGFMVVHHSGYVFLLHEGEYDEMVVFSAVSVNSLNREIVVGVYNTVQELLDASVSMLRLMNMQTRLLLSPWKRFKNSLRCLKYRTEVRVERRCEQL